MQREHHLRQGGSTPHVFHMDSMRKSKRGEYDWFGVAKHAGGHRKTADVDGGCFDSFRAPLVPKIYGKVPKDKD